MEVMSRSTPDSNIVLAQIRPTSGPCEIHAGQMLARSVPTLLAVWDICQKRFPNFMKDFITSVLRCHGNTPAEDNEEITWSLLCWDPVAGRIDAGVVQWVLLI